MKTETTRLPALLALLVLLLFLLGTVFFGSIAAYYHYRNAETEVVNVEPLGTCKNPAIWTDSSITVWLIVCGDNRYVSWAIGDKTEMDPQGEIAPIGDNGFAQFVHGGIPSEPEVYLIGIKVNLNNSFESVQVYPASRGILVGFERTDGINIERDELTGRIDVLLADNGQIAAGFTTETVQSYSKPDYKNVTELMLVDGNYVGSVRLYGMHGFVYTAFVQADASGKIISVSVNHYDGLQPLDTYTPETGWRGW